MLHPECHFQDLLHEEQQVKPSKYSNRLRHIVIRFGIKTQGLQN